MSSISEGRAFVSINDSLHEDDGGSAGGSRVAAMAWSSMAMMAWSCGMSATLCDLPWGTLSEKARQ